MIASLGIKQSFAAGPLPIAAAAADVNGDGKPDLIAADDNGSRVSVLRNTTRLVPPAPASPRCSPDPWE